MEQAVQEKLSRLLLKVPPGEEVAGGKLGKVVDQDSLEQAGLIVVRREGRARKVLLTEAGRIRREEIARATPAKAPRAPRAPGAQAALLDKLTRLEQTLAGLAREVTLQDALRRIARLEAALAPPGDARSTPPDELKVRVLETIADLDASRRYGGLVPIPEIRRALRGAGTTDVALTAALEELEREFAIDLNIAQSPSIVADRHEGIERPGRGLLYYVSRR